MLHSVYGVYQRFKYGNKIINASEAYTQQADKIACDWHVLRDKFIWHVFFCCSFSFLTRCLISTLRRSRSNSKRIRFSLSFRWIFSRSFYQSLCNVAVFSSSEIVVVDDVVVAADVAFVVVVVIDQLFSAIVHYMADVRACAVHKQSAALHVARRQQMNKRSNANWIIRYVIESNDGISDNFRSNSIKCFKRLPMSTYE